MSDTTTTQIDDTTGAFEDEDGNRISVNPVSGELVEYSDPADDIIADAIASLRDGNALAYSSITGTDFDTKIQLLQAVTNSEAFADNIGREIALTNFICQIAELENEKTHVKEKAPRWVLIDNEGNAFHAFGMPLFTSLRNIVGMAGEPSTWETPIRVKFLRNKAKGPGYYYSLAILGALRLDPASTPDPKATKK